PNILLIVADDLGHHDVGYHGSVIKTPNIDHLAYTGVRLENYYVQPICTPSRSQLMTGRYQIHTGLQHNIINPFQPNAVPLDLPMLPEVLKQNGYSTHMVGKWHLGFYKDEVLPMNRGFDSYYGYLTGSEDYFTHRRCGALPGANKTVCGIDLRNDFEVDWNQTGKYSTQLFAEKAEDVVRKHAVHQPDQPLFLYVAFQAVHAPNQVPNEYLKPYDIDDPKRRLLAGMVTCMDEAVGNITAAFKDTGLWDNTVVVFTTDNGGDVNENSGNNWPLRGWKHSLWEGGMRGVGFVNSPLLKSFGYPVNGLMHVSDWFPTLLNLAGANTSSISGLDGHDIWKSIAEREDSPRKELLHNIDPLYPPRGSKLNHTYDVRVRSALRVGDFKIITGDPFTGSWVPPPEYHKKTIPDPDPRSKNVWLFNVHEDPCETTDLSVALPGVLTMMLDKLLAYNATAVPCVFPDDDPRSNPEEHGGAFGPW
ncbi:hypothetical protein CAPTEDRAFT_53259, partial [Capitella teleta]